MTRQALLDLAALGSDRAMGKRWFKSLTDAELIAYRPKAERGWLGWSDHISCQNVGAANREMRRRSKLAGLAGPYEWLALTSLSDARALAQEIEHDSN